MEISKGFRNLDLQQSLQRLDYYPNGTSMIPQQSLLRVANLECVKQDLVDGFEDQFPIILLCQSHIFEDRFLYQVQIF